MKFIIASLITHFLALAACAAPQPARAAEGSYPDLAVDAAGDVHLVYVRDATLYYRKLTAATQTWSAEQSTGLRADGPNRSDPEVVTDALNRPHVLAGRAYAWQVS